MPSSSSSSTSSSLEFSSAASSSSGSGSGSGSPSRFWYVGSSVYDLEKFKNIHPGGAIFIDVTRGRDCSYQVYTHHPDPERILRVLSSYKVSELHLDERTLKSAMMMKDDNLDDKDEDTSSKDQRNASLSTIPLARIFPPSFLWPFFTSTAFAASHFMQSARYRFSSDTLLKTIQTACREDRALAKSIKDADTRFDYHSNAVVAAYIAIVCITLLIAPQEPTQPAFIVLLIIMTVIRTAAACTGHYALHSPANRINQLKEQLFELNYMTVSFIQRDAHTILHHGGTSTVTDPKHLALTRFRSVPLLYRVFAHSIRNFGLLVSGYFLSQIFVYNDLYTKQNWMRDHSNDNSAVKSSEKSKVNGYGNNSGSNPSNNNDDNKTYFHLLTFFAPRCLHWFELIFFAYRGCTTFYMMQFFICLWYNTFIVLSNHDYAHLPPFLDRLMSPSISSSSSSWVLSELNVSRDLSLSGFASLDCWLTGGLSCHRIHHILPFQRSPYANIASHKRIMTIIQQQQQQQQQTRVIVGDEQRSDDYNDGLPLSGLSALKSFVLDYLSTPASIDMSEAFALGKNEKHKHTINATQRHKRVRLYPNFIQEHASIAAIIYTIKYALQGFKGEI